MKLPSAALSAGSFLLKKVRSDADEFSALFHKHQGLVRKVIYQIAGDNHLNDLTQETFIRIWQNRSQFRYESELTSWIYRISVNVALDSLRKTKRLSEISSFDFSTMADESRDSERKLADQQLVQRGLMALNEDHRTVLVLALIHELSLKEISQILEISEGTVKSRLHYAKEHFRQFFSELTEKKGSSHER